jgi:hypothetical protein
MEPPKGGCYDPQSRYSRWMFNAFRVVVQVRAHYAPHRRKLRARANSLPLAANTDVVNDALSFKLSHSSIDGIPLACLAAHESEFHRWASVVQPRLLAELSNFYCLPGRAGGSPLDISGSRSKADFRLGVTIQRLCFRSRSEAARHPWLLHHLADATTSTSGELSPISLPPSEHISE